MPALKNRKHEQFCQALTRGMSATEAYLHAGYESKDKATAQPAAARLRAKSYCQQRLRELSDEVERVTIRGSTMDLAWWRTTLMDTIRLAAEKGDLGLMRALLETSGKHLGAFDADHTRYSGAITDRRLDTAADDTEVAALYRELLASEPEQLPENVTPLATSKKQAS